MTTEVKPRYAGSDWLRSALKDRPISPLGERVADLLGDLFRGLYHWSGYRRVDWSSEHHIRVTIGWQSWSTWDFNDLTRLVFLAHHYAIRVQLGPCNFRHFELMFHQRDPEATKTSRRHPTLRQAVTAFEKEMSDS